MKTLTRVNRSLMLRIAFVALMVLAVMSISGCSQQSGMVMAEDDGQMDHDHNDMSADHSDHDHSDLEPIDIEAGKPHPTIEVSVTQDPKAGWNLHIETTDFRFAPENASTPHVLGEGHAHIYINGEKLARLYTHDFHIASLPEGKQEITVSLNGNNHAPYYYDGQPIDNTVTVDVPAHDEMEHSHAMMDAVEIPADQPEPTITARVEKDPMMGYNLFIETTNFTFAPEHASSEPVMGEGHAHIYIDGEKLARLYGHSYHIMSMEPGTHEVTVSLNANNHAAISYGGEELAVTVTIEVE